MKVTQLRIGNLVYNNDKDVATVATINQDFEDEPYYCELRLKDGLYLEENVKDIKPIPLTEEWLFRFGFEKGETTKRKGNGSDYQPENVFTITTRFRLNDTVSYLFQEWHHRNGIDNEDHFVYGDNSLVRCKYVHQLQNLYYALTGEELTLKK